MGASPDDQLLASPRNFFLGRKRRMAELFAELFGRSFLPFPHFAAVDYDIMAIPTSLDLDLAKFDQSRFNFSMFRCLELKALKYYRIDFRNKGIFYEAVTNHILDDLVKACSPRRMTVVGDFSVRGGISTTVTATYEQGQR